MPLKPYKLSDLEFEEDFERKTQYLIQRWTWDRALHSVEDHPAQISVYHPADGKPYVAEEMWYTHGLRHRDRGPAWIRYASNGVIFQKTYFRNGLIHRADGPAFENGIEIKYYKYGMLHRTDGPAVIYPESDFHHNMKPSDSVLWYIDGNEYTLEDWGNHEQVDPEIFTMMKLEYGS